MYLNIQKIKPSYVNYELRRLGLWICYKMFCKIMNACPVVEQSGTCYVVHGNSTQLM